MDRRAFIGTLAGGLLAAPLTVEGQQAGTIPTVGILTSRAERSRPLEEGLRELGWVEGKNVRFERRFTLDYQELPRFVRELLRVQAVKKLGLKVTEDPPGGSFAATDADRDIRGQCLPDIEDPRGPKAK